MGRNLLDPLPEANYLKSWGEKWGWGSGEVRKLLAGGNRVEFLNYFLVTDLSTQWVPWGLSGCAEAARQTALGSVSGSGLLDKTFALY